MPVYARHASTWKTVKTVFAHHAGVWKACVGVWARSGGIWRKLAGALTGASADAGDTTTNECFFYPPQSSCTASASPTAYPLDGYAPFSFQWYLASADPGVFFGNTTSQSCFLSADVGQFNGKNASVYCVVTDATGAQATTNTVSVLLRGANGSV